MSDPINHPSHYTSGPSCPNCAATIECITITERKSFNVGNAIKYLWRAGLKGDKNKQMEDLRKAAWPSPHHFEQTEGGVMPQRTRKTCPKCSTEKAINDFPRSSRRADGHGSWCRSCTAIYSRQRRRDPEVKRRESERAEARYAAMTDEERGAYIARGVARRRARGEGQLARYCLTRSDYDALLASQGGGCAMCGREPTSGRLLAVDHDHSCCPAGRGCCGKCVRGLLCVTCNVWLGFYENESWTSSAEAYLSRYCLREADRLGVES